MQNIGLSKHLIKQIDDGISFNLLLYKQKLLTAETLICFCTCADAIQFPKYVHTAIRKSNYLLTNKMQFLQPILFRQWVLLTEVGYFSVPVYEQGGSVAHSCS